MPEFHDILSAKVEDEHHVQMDQVCAEGQPAQWHQKWPRKKFVDDSCKNIVLWHNFMQKLKPKLLNQVITKNNCIML